MQPVVAAENFDVLVVGAGPTGMACAIETQRAGLSTVTVDKGCLCNSLFHYPSNMTFFTTPELLEIGDIPFSSPNQKPTRNEALEYYRKVAEHYQLDLRQYQTVTSIKGEDGDFTVHTVDQFGRKHSYGARKLILATGYYDLPNYLDIPGEDLPKVMHYYHDPHPYYDQKVLVIGGKNSAAIAALDLWRHGAHVTLVHRGDAMHSRAIKYWILPDINNRIKNGEVAAYFNSTVTNISEDSVDLLTPQGVLTLENDFVFALTGYHPDFEFLSAAGVKMEGEDRCPVCDPQSLESNVPGLYLAGVIVAGARTNEIFIENGRFHGRQIAQDIEARLDRTSVKVG
jgi:thioredoxin reductase (NADPH)